MNPSEYYNFLGAELKTIEDQIRELKQKQFAGTDTVKTYENKNTGWDIDWTPDFYGFGTQRTMDKSVLFIADSQSALISNMRYEILVNNTNWYTIGAYDAPFMGLVSVGASLHDSFLSYADEVPTIKKDAWYFSVTVYVSLTNVKVRFIVDSTDTGTIVVQDIAV